MYVRPESALHESTARSPFAIPRSTARAASGIAAAGIAALLTWAAAEVRIPLQPVPITLQTLVVILAGALIGAGRGTASQMVYLGLGVAGVPLFAGASAGLAVLAGPTGGYLLGFIVAPIIVGRCMGARAGFARALVVFSVGAAAILTLGVIHLAVFYTGDLWAAARVGLFPFVLGDALKVLAAASVYCTYRRLRAEPRVG